MPGYPPLNSVFIEVQHKLNQKNLYRPVWIPTTPFFRLGVEQVRRGNSKTWLLRVEEEFEDVETQQVFREKLHISECDVAVQVAQAPFLEALFAAIVLDKEAFIAEVDAAIVALQAVVDQLEAE